MKRTCVVIGSSLFLLVSVAIAQPPGAKGQPDFLRGKLFPPEAIMRNHSEIGLTAEKRKAIQQEVQKLQTSMIESQWERQEATEKMGKFFAAVPIDEEKALAQAESVFQLESTMKRAHLQMLIRIKNHLTPEQIEKLAQISGE